MLVLTRKPGERLRVGDVLVVSVDRAEQGKVTLVLETALPLTLMPGDVEVGSADGSPVRVTRKLDDSVLAGTGAGQVRLVIVSVKGEQVRLGVDAPREMQVHRWEIWEAIRAQNEAAGEAVPIDPQLIQRLREKAQDPPGV